MEHHPGNASHSRNITDEGSPHNHTALMPTSYMEGHGGANAHHEDNQGVPFDPDNHGHAEHDDEYDNGNDTAHHDMHPNWTNHHMGHDEHENHMTDLLNFGNASSPSPCDDSLYCIVEQAVVVTVPLLIIFGNIVTISVLLKTKSLRNCHGYYLLSLAVADLLMGPVALSAVFPVFYSYWPFGIVTCFTTAYVAEVCMKVSLLMLVWLSIERYIAIYYPFRYNKWFSPRNTVLSIVGSWAFCNLVYLVTIPTEVICFSYESDKYMCTVTYFLHPEYVIAIVLAFLVPSFFIVTVTNLMSSFRIFQRQLQKSNTAANAGESKNYQPRVQLNKNKRAFRILITLLASFYVCWLPYICIHIYAYSSGNTWHLNHYLEFYSYWLAVANSCVNPIIYFGMNKTFKQATCVLLRGVATCSGRGGALSDAVGSSEEKQASYIAKDRLTSLSTTQSYANGACSPAYEPEVSDQ